MQQQTILVIDDEPDIRVLVKDILEDEGFRVDVADSAAGARTKIAKYTPDLVLLDIWMSHEDGISLLREWRENDHKVFPVVVMSGHGTVETAVEATRLGADNFIEKPLTIAKLLQVVRHALTLDEGDSKTHRLVRKPVGSSAVMRKLRQQSQRLAQQKGHILITGEQGVDKEMLARYIHSLSDYAANDFICYGADLAWDTTTGPATLFVDFSVVSLAHKERLLHLLQQDDWYNIRLMVAALDKLAQDQWETQLLELLQVKEIHFPTLREHAEDIPEILNASVDYYCQRHQLAYRKFSIAAQNYLLHYNWQGNLKEVDALVCQLLQLNKEEDISLDEIKLLLIPQHDDYHLWFEEAMQKPMREARELFENAYLRCQLEKANGSVRRLATNIGMERTHLYRKLRSLGINYSDSGK